MKLTHLLIDGLAAHRLARLVVDEDSPASTWIRSQAEQRLPAAWAPAIECRHCTGLWAALALGGLRAVGLGALAYPLAVAGLTSVILEHLHPEHDVPEPQGPVIGERVIGDPATPADDHDYGWASGERQGIPYAGIAAGVTGGLDPTGQAYRALVGRALTGQERATGLTTVSTLGEDYADGTTRALAEDEQRYGRLAR